MKPSVKIWAWSYQEDADFWSPGGNSRDQTIQIARAKTCREDRYFWIAPLRKSTAQERESLEDCGEWIVDAGKIERIKIK